MAMPAPAASRRDAVLVPQLPRERRLPLQLFLCRELRRREQMVGLPSGAGTKRQVLRIAMRLSPPAPLVSLPMEREPRLQPRPQTQAPSRPSRTLPRRPLELLLLLLLPLRWWQLPDHRQL